MSFNLNTQVSTNAPRPPTDEQVAQFERMLGRHKKDSKYWVMMTATRDKGLVCPAPP